MKKLNAKTVAAAVTVALIAGAALADITTRVHYRCWDNTARESVGGWVSTYAMAERNCEIRANAFPNNDLWIESEEY